MADRIPHIRFRTVVSDDCINAGLSIVDENDVCRFVEYDTLENTGRVLYIDPRTRKRTEHDPYPLDNDRALLYGIQSWLHQGCIILPGWEEGEEGYVPVHKEEGE